MLRIFTRLWFGIALFLLGISSLIVTELIGHSQNGVSANKTSQCIFLIRYDEKRFAYHVPTLRMHWSSLVPANVLLGIGPLLVTTAVYEFIAAQSPHSMKGLIVGLFLTIRTLFLFVSVIATLPFSLNSLWGSEHFKEHPPVTNCGFGFLLLICVFALIGFILFSVAAKKYKYRERDDKPYDHRFVIDVYTRAIESRKS